MNPKEICKQLTLKEKIALCSGGDFWHTKDLSRFGLPAVMMCDGPHGLRCQQGKADMLGVHNSRPATCFPTASITACSWDTQLLASIGKAIAEEAKAKNVGIVLGPGVNIKRDPLCGRNFEYFSEDPHLAGALAASFIQGAQSTGVGTSLKHFALNNQEYKRCVGSSQADERTMREIYLAAFEKPVREGKPDTVMCAYNQVNGTFCSDHSWLLTEVLRKQWGFQGTVITDWGAMSNRVAAMKAGCDLMMPGGSDYMEKELYKAVAEGTLSMRDINRCALRVLKLMQKTGAVQVEPCNLHDHHILARRAAGESAVLLKNQDALLPLKPETSVALIGVMAGKPRYQGGGSSHINPLKLVSACEAFPEAIYARGCREDGSTDEELLQEAAEKAKKVQVAVVFAGLPPVKESEGFDRQDMKMPEGHIRLIRAVAAANPNTVVILCCGGAVECPWAEDVKSILYMGLAGEACGEAARDLLYGIVNPGGKLAESWPYTYQDCPTAENYRMIRNPQYREGIYVGYRYYDKANVAPRWPFGYGLSYTEFAYSGLNIEGDRVTCRVKNTGQYPGSEVVQLYVEAPQKGLHRPIKELKGFQKVFLEPGQEAELSFGLEARSFALWHDGWQIPGGDYGILICSDSRTVRLSGTVRKEGPEIPAPAWQKDSWYEKPLGTPSLEQWEQLYGKAPREKTIEKGSFTMDSTVVEMRPHSLVGKLLYWSSEQVLIATYGKRDYENSAYVMMMHSATDSPLRNMQICSALKGGLMKGVMHMANGHYGKGLLTVCGIDPEP